MATIQNQAVIQKLIDDLELYPALEKMPTELADKILPVFQVNSEQLSIQMKPTYLQVQDLTLNDSDKSFVIPDGHTYVVKYGWVNYKCSADAGNRYLMFEIQDKAGNVVWQNDFEGRTMAANNEWNFRINPSSVDQNVFFAGGSDNTIGVAIPPEFALLEGFTFRIYDVATIAVGADDMKISLMVDDQAD